MKVPGRRAVFAFLLGWMPIIHAAELTGIDLQFIDDSNPARAEFDRDIEETSSFRGRVTGQLWSSEGVRTDRLGSGLSLNASASYEHNADIEELGESRYRIGLGAFREYPTRGAQPFWRFGLGLGYLDAEADLRDGPIVDASVSLNLQPTSFFDTTIGLQAEVRDADTEVFDTTKLQGFLTGNFSPAPRVVLRSGLRYVVGDEISTATPTLDIVETAEVIEPDPAFGGVDANRFAYLLDAQSAIAEAGIGYAFTAAIEGNFLFRYVNTEADNDISYERTLFEFTLSLEL